MKTIEVSTKTPFSLNSVSSVMEIGYHYAEVSMANLLKQLHRQLEINEEVGREVFSPKDMFETALTMLDTYVTVKEKEE